MANISSTATRPPQWAADFCERYTPFTFDFAKWLLIVGLILGILAAVTAAIKEFRQSVPGGGVKAAAGQTAFIDALKGFIEALGNGPAWLAIFGGGILLLWMAGHAIPDFCKPQGASQQQPPSPPPGAGG